MNLRIVGIIKLLFAQSVAQGISDLIMEESLTLILQLSAMNADILGFGMVHHHKW